MLKVEIKRTKINLWDLALKVEIEEKKLNSWNQYITQHKLKTITKYNSQNNIILHDENKKQIKKIKIKLLKGWIDKIKSKKKKKTQIIIIRNNILWVWLQ
jgi:hypothetical protein